MSEQPNQEQLNLLSPAELDRVTDKAFEDHEQALGIYSGKDFKRYNPALYQEVIEAIAEGDLSQRKIAKKHKVSRNLVAGIARAQVSDIEPLKKKLGNHARSVAALSIERMEELILDPTAKISFKDLGIAAGVLIDKSLLLHGDANQIVNKLQGATDDHAAFGEYLESLRAADIDETGFVGGNEGTKGGGLEIGAGDAGAGDAGAGERVSAGGEDQAAESGANEGGDTPPLASEGGEGC